MLISYLWALTTSYKGFILELGVWSFILILKKNDNLISKSPGWPVPLPGWGLQVRSQRGGRVGTKPSGEKCENHLKKIPTRNISSLNPNNGNAPRQPFWGLRYGRRSWPCRPWRRMEGGTTIQPRTGQEGEVFYFLRSVPLPQVIFIFILELLPFLLPTL